MHSTSGPVGQWSIRLALGACLALSVQACGGGGGGGSTPVDHARLDACVLVGATVGEGCTTAGGAAALQLGDMAMGETKSRVLALYNGGDGDVAATVSAVQLAPAPAAHYVLSTFTLQGGVETPAALPFALAPNHGTELRVRVTFTANVPVGAVSGVRVDVTATKPAETEQVPITGNVTGCPAGRGDCDGDPANACETDVDTDLAHCGGCGTACSDANGTPSCTDGVCGITCATGFDNCDGGVENGCEAPLATDPAHCGTCANACDATNGTASCADSTCAIACDGGFGDCGAAPGCETDLRSDVGHCGACGAACSDVNGTPSCAAGACAIACDQDWGDCDGDVANGCETSLTDTVAHCGACGTACSDANGTASCTAGVCAIACTGGFDDCDGDVTNGCEAELATDPLHCGGCAIACNATNGTATCTAGTCGITCSAGFADCDGNAANGCEVDLRTDPVHCGACATACDATNGTPSCAAGVCGIACAPGFGDCDASAANGCEVSLETDPLHCGACADACSTTNGTPSCAVGTCAISCTPGFGDCDASAATGCEVNLEADAAHCGGCGLACSATNGTPSCTAGLCAIACDGGYGDCDVDAATGCEASLDTDPLHCGGCGLACDATNGTATCAAGVCGITCNAGFADCDGDATNGCEVNLDADTAHCGGCGTICDATNGTASCTAGVCGIACNDGYGDCDGSAATGCEVNLNDDTTHCGACVVACDGTNGTASCTAGVCGIACNPDFADCDGTAANGCEVSLQTDPTHCGACVNACSSNNGTPSCTGGSCGIACAGGFADCDLNVATGCETNLATDPLHCSACGAACDATNGTPFCDGGACGIACNPDFGDCDASAATGCESNLPSDPSNCGACGAPCATPPNAVPGCTGGTCGIAACNPGYEDCDLDAGTGCEQDVTNDVLNCGACGAVCSATANVASYGCASSACAIGACAAGWTDWDGAYGDGCECKEPSASANCAAPTVIAPLTATGQSAFGPLDGVPGGRWAYYAVSFPMSGATYGGGAPRISFVRNDGGYAVFDVLTSCGGSYLGCGSGGFAAAVTDWQFTDNQSPSYLTRTTGWPTSVIVRVRQRPGTTGCPTYQLQFTR